MKHWYIIVLAALLSSRTTTSAQADLYDINTIQDIQIKFHADNWRYLLDSLRFNGDEFLDAELTVNGKLLPKDVGIRYRDGRSFTPGGKRNGLYISFNHLARDFSYEGRTALDLSSALRDPTLIREVLASEIASQYMPTPRANYAKVSINGEFYGLFVNIEVVKDAFLSRHFGSIDRDVYYAGPQLSETAPGGCGPRVYGSLQHETATECLAHNFDQITGVSWHPLTNLTETLASHPDQLDKVLDVDQALWMLAFNNLTVNLNSYTGQYANQYYLAQNANDQLAPILGEFNLAFGSFKNTGISESDLVTPQLVQLDPMLHADNAGRPLISKLLANEYLRKRYLSHYRTLLADWFTNGKYEQRAKELRDFIRPVVAADINQYYTAEEYNKSLTEVVGSRSRIPGLLDFMAKRVEWLKSQPLYTILPPAITEVGVEQRQRLASQQLQEFRIHAKVEGYPKRVRVFYRFEDKGLFQSMDMYDDGKHADQQAADGIFGVAVVPAAGQTAIYYYIEAENVAAISFNPARYMYELHTTTLAKINQ